VCGVVVFCGCCGGFFCCRGDWDPGGGDGPPDWGVRPFHWVRVGRKGPLPPGPGQDDMTPRGYRDKLTKRRRSRAREYTSLGTLSAIFLEGCWPPTQGCEGMVDRSAALHPRERKTAVSHQGRIIIYWFPPMVKIQLSRKGWKGKSRGEKNSVETLA